MKQVFNRPSLCTEVWNPTCSHQKAYMWHSQDEERHIWVTWQKWASSLLPKHKNTLQRSGWDLLSWYPPWLVTPGDHPQMSGCSNCRGSHGLGRLTGAQARQLVQSMTCQWQNSKHTVSSWSNSGADQGHYHWPQSDWNLRPFWVSLAASVGNI